MRNIVFFLYAVGSFSLPTSGSTAYAAQPANIDEAAAGDAEHYGQTVRSHIIDNEGRRAGEVRAWQGRGGVLLQVRLHGLPRGAHAVHVHQNGRCDDIETFNASGGHIGTTIRPHGMLNPDGPHEGDLPNIYAGSDGTAQADFFSPLIAISDFQDADGAAVIIHESGDDYQTQPIGNAGKRIACAPFPARR